MIPGLCNKKEPDYPQNPNPISFIHPLFLLSVLVMATLHPSFPTASIAVGKVKTTIAASAANLNSPSQTKKTDDIVRGALMSADCRRLWWAPLFRIGGGDKETEQRKTGDLNQTESEKPAKSTARRMVFTDEKARLLRKELRATESWRDRMYHSAIAARLASPDQ